MCVASPPHAAQPGPATSAVIGPPALLRPTGNATKFAITDLHDWFEHRRCPNLHTLGANHLAVTGE